MYYTVHQAAADSIRLSRIPAIVVEFFQQVHSYRDYLVQAVGRDLRTRYKRSVLGYVWTMLNPFCMMLVMSVVFSHIMHFPIRDYSVFLFAGLLPWNFFQSSSLMALVSIRANSRLLSQVALPKYIIVLSLVCSNLVNLFLALVPLVGLMVALGRPVPVSALALPLVALPLFVTVVGSALLLSASGVFFHDTLHIGEVGLQALYFLSPILYHRELLPPGLVRYLSLNPLFCEIEFFRGVFYDGVLPDPTVYLLNLGGALLLLLTGLFVFRRSEDSFLYFV